jgi:4'-phosphopantetheinyl transferase
MLGLQATPEFEIVVRFARAENLAGGAHGAAALALLGPEERRRLARMRTPGARTDFLAAHALTRLTLAEFARCRPTGLTFRHSAQGRPEVDRPRRARPINFSLSHADGFVLCAVARGCAVGSDVESERDLGLDPLGVASAVCGEHEHHELRRLPRVMRASRVLTVWAMKEAVAKATGRQDYISLASVAVDVEDASLRANASTVRAIAGDGSAWRVTWLRIEPYHVAAIAVPATLAETATFSFEEARFETGSALRASA